ncbi:MAG: hypothetical protein WD995_05065 [Gemmatimonadota bacterium]
MEYAALCMALILGSPPASAQEVFDLQFDHSTVLVSNLEASAAFYATVLQLGEVKTPWGPTAPIRFYSVGGNWQLHVGQSDQTIEPDKNTHLAFAIQNFDAYLRFLRDQGIRVCGFPRQS